MTGMERRYRLMYRLGLTPWDNPSIPAELVDVAEGPSALPPGVALDIGCGTGLHAAYLADHGWQVTAFDVVTAAIEQARARSADVQWHTADLAGSAMTSITDGLAGRVTLVLDVGCLHGLDSAGRAAWGVAVDRVAAPGATLLLRAAPPRASRSITPRGIDQREVADLVGPLWKPVSMRSLDWSRYERSPG